MESQVEFAMYTIKKYLEQNGEISQEQKNNNQKKKIKGIIEQNSKNSTTLQFCRKKPAVPSDSKLRSFSWKRQVQC